jgi:hypothetical protein
MSITRSKFYAESRFEISDAVSGNPDTGGRFLKYL